MTTRFRTKQVVFLGAGWCQQFYRNISFNKREGDILDVHALHLLQICSALMLLQQPSCFPRQGVQGSVCKNFYWADKEASGRCANENLSTVLCNGSFITSMLEFAGSSGGFCEKRAGCSSMSKRMYLGHWLKRTLSGVSL